MGAPLTETSSSIRDLKAAISAGQSYFSAGPPMDVAYVRDRLRDVLRDAVQEVKGHFIAEHNVDTDSTPVVVHYTSLRALFSMLHRSVEPHVDQEPSGPGAAADTSTTAEGNLHASPEEGFAGAPADGNVPGVSGGNDDRPTDRRYLRLYDCANLNDPLEGAYFLKELVGEQDTLEVVLEHVIQVPAYITSFVTPKQNADNRPQQRNQRARDNLAFWRLYGQEGRGCSITIPVGGFQPQQRSATLQKVIYGYDSARTNARRLRPVLECLSPIVQGAGQSRRPAVQRQVAATLLECLGEIPYLYKSSAYSYEEECRIVAMESDLEGHGGILYDFEAGRGESGRLRMYGQHPCLRLTNILATDSVITLGPSIPNADYVQYAIERLLRSIGIRNLTIEKSGISYRRT